MTKEAAPSELLRIIWYGCTQNVCTNNRCSCYKSGLKCSTAKGADRWLFDYMFKKQTDFRPYESMYSKQYSKLCRLLATLDSLMIACIFVHNSIRSLTSGYACIACTVDWIPTKRYNFSHLLCISLRTQSERNVGVYEAYRDTTQTRLMKSKWL